jgi:hypothetical protein
MTTTLHPASELRELPLGARVESSASGEVYQVVENSQGVHAFRNSYNETYSMNSVSFDFYRLEDLPALYNDPFAIAAAQVVVAASKQLGEKVEPWIQRLAESK